MCLGLWLIKTEREIGYCDRIKPDVNFHMAKCDISFIGLLELWQTKGCNYCEIHCDANKSHLLDDRLRGNLNSSYQ